MVDPEDVAHSRFWMQPDSSLTNAFSLCFQSESKLSSGSEKSCRPDLGNTLILRGDEVRETIQLGQRSLIVCAKLISPKILTSFLSPFPKATLRL